MITLDNTAANGTICEKVERLHEGRNLVWNAHENQLMYALQAAACDMSSDSSI